MDIDPPSSIVVLSESSSYFLSAATYARVASLLDGSHEVTEMLDLLDGDASAAEVYYALMQLEDAGHIVDAEHDVAGLSRAEQAYWDAAGVSSAAAKAALARIAVAVSALGEVDPAPIANALTSANVITADRAGAGLDVLVVDDYLHPDLVAIHRNSLDAGRPWMLVKPTGRQLWIGPVFVPGRNGCWECLAQRIRANRQAQRFLERSGGGSVVADGVIAASVASGRIAAELLSSELVLWITGSPHSRLESRLLAFDAASGRTSDHTFVRRPQCRSCGDSLYKNPNRDLPPLLLHSRPRQFPGFVSSTRTPEAALASYRRHISPITGVIAEIHSDRPVPGLLYGHVTVHDFPIWSADISSLKDNLRGRSGGHGATETESELSAVGEAIERYSGAWRGEEEIRRRASMREMGAAAIDPSECLLFSENQVATRKSWNAAQTIPNHLVPGPLPETLEIDWTPLSPLTGAGVRYVPSTYVYYGHPDMEHNFSYCDSNGCAAGNTLEEALLTAIVELIERDAVAIWWYNRIRRRGLSLQDVPYGARLAAFYRGIGRDLTVIDITSDIGIPCFAASSARLDADTDDLMLGFGAHPDARQALMRTLSELNQFYPMVSAHESDGQTIYATANGDAIDWLTAAKRSSEDYLNADPALPLATLSDYPRRVAADVRSDVEYCVAALKQQGIEAWLLDQTRPDIEVPVCRVVAPGLRHFWRRLGPGRLYDVPVRLGWLPSVKSEWELNPFSIFF